MRLTRKQRQVGMSMPQRLLFIRVLQLCRTAQAEYPVTIIGNTQLWLDIAVPEKMLDIEYDGRYWHRRARDILRDATLIAMGWKVVRIREGDDEVKVRMKLERCLL